MPVEQDLPHGALATRTLAMPTNTNPAGDVFGGWLLSQMDIAGGIIAHRRARGRVATIAVNSMEFHRPVFVGDVVSCYATIERVGRTSLTVHIEVWAAQRDGDHQTKVTEGKFTFVAIDQARQPRPVPSESETR